MLNEQRASALILGAGASRRMGGDDKMFARVCGKPLLYWTILAFERSNLIDEIVVVLNESNLKAAKKLAEREKFSRVRMLVQGGERRQDSVQQGLEHAQGASHEQPGRPGPAYLL